MKPLIFIGMMGSGKTTIGKALSKELNLTWIDTDDSIQKQSQLPIPTLFEIHGETYFRKLESQTLKSVIDNYQCISTGGGIIVSQENRKLIKKEAFVIHLTATIPTLIQRLNNSDRPLLQGVPLEERLISLLNLRTKFYTDCADLTIDTSFLTIEEIVEKIKSELDSNFLTY